MSTGGRDDALSMTERGRTLAALRLLGPIAAAARLRSAAARHHLERLCDPAARAREEAALGLTIPQGLGRIDPSWYTTPPATSSAAARRYLERIAYARLVAMESRTPAPAPEQRGALARSQQAFDRLLAGPTERLLDGLLSLGLRRVAIAFTGAPRSALAQLLARVGEPEATKLAAEVRAIPPGVSAEEVKNAQRALFRSGPEPQVGESAMLFFRRVGCGWIAPLTEAHGDRARRLAQRLPRSLGEIILREHAQPITEAERATLLRQCAAISG